MRPKTTGKYKSRATLEYNVLRKHRGNKSPSQIAKEVGTTVSVVNRILPLH